MSVHFISFHLISFLSICLSIEAASFFVSIHRFYVSQRQAQSKSIVCTTSFRYRSCRRLMTSSSMHSTATETGQMTSLAADDADDADDAYPTKASLAVGANDSSCRPKDGKKVCQRHKTSWLGASEKKSSYQ